MVVAVNMKVANLYLSLASDISLQFKGGARCESGVCEFFRKNLGDVIKNLLCAFVVSRISFVEKHIRGGSLGTLLTLFELDLPFAFQIRFVADQDLQDSGTLFVN